jgi:hypothetical protein
MKNNMNIQEQIRRILKEETEDIPKRTPLEKSITDFVNMLLKDYELPENFYGVAVDILDDNETCEITVLFNKSFKINDSDKAHIIVRKIRQEVSNYFGFNVRGNTSTVNNYNDFYERYYLPRK